MKRIPLTQDKFAIVDDEDYDWLNQWNWHAHKDRNTYYAKRTTSYGATIRMHRLILGAKKGQITDHRNRNGLDNQRHNIRICTLSENQQNRPAYPNGTSKYKGVWWWADRQRWGSMIRVNNKRYYLGSYVNEIDAAKIYDKKAKELFGVFAYCNF